jgi:hypothetical protein
MIQPEIAFQLPKTNSNRWSEYFAELNSDLIVSAQ